MIRYTYDTGQIERDFHLKKVDGRCCTKSNLPAGTHCLGCEHYGGNRNGFVFCRLPGITDDESSKPFLYDMLDKFKEEAITHYYD